MISWITKIFGNKKQNRKEIPLLHLSRLSSYDDYKKYANKYQRNDIAMFSFEKNLLPETQKEFTFNGYCYVCRKIVNFLVDFEYSYEVNGILMPNWRESLLCPSCHLNNRMRAALHIFEQECQPNYNSKIYITEQITPLYNQFKKSFTHIYGSEYLGNSVAYGTYNNKGIRNEDLTKLSFSKDEFDYILSFDTFEHIPNYKEALKECLRCLKPGGILYFSVPFVKTAEKNIVRAYVSKNGEVKHLLPPEYHGDPLNPNGCLCFYHFGWEILDELRMIGFKYANALLYWSEDLGYLGGEQIIFTATKNI